MTARTKVVALGGGHGLHASLSALRQLDVDITAVVTVADDGGSSGRIRQELNVLPPGDLRMALSALAGPAAVTSATGTELVWDTLLQHRLGGDATLAGHPVGNLILTGLLELYPDPVAALDLLGTIVGAQGRVLPMAPIPLDLVAEVTSAEPGRLRTVRGQNAIALAAGRVESIELIPAAPPACRQAVEAILEADAVLLGPGSWFTSVLPHLLVPELAAALVRTSAAVVAVLNLVPQQGETDGFSPQDHLSVLSRYCPSLRLAAVIADSAVVTQPTELAEFVRALGAELITAAVAEPGGAARHDPRRLSRAILAALDQLAADRETSLGAGRTLAGEEQSTRQGAR